MITDIRLNRDRIGNFTSSPIAALMSNGKAAGTTGKPFLTYVKAKNRERKLGRCLENDSFSRPTSWGKLVEVRLLNDILPLEYEPCSAQTLKHQTIDCWVGTPDCLKHDEGLTVVSAKCPFTLSSFLDFADCQTIEDVRNNHSEGEDYYWQLISDAILTGAKFAELVAYLPFQNELQDIRTLAYNYEGADKYKYYWISNSSDEELPYLPNHCGYENKYIFRFEVPQSDKDALTARVLQASELLIPFDNTIKVENLQY